MDSLTGATIQPILDQAPLMDEMELERVENTTLNKSMIDTVELAASDGGPPPIRIDVLKGIIYQKAAIRTLLAIKQIEGYPEKWMESCEDRVYGASECLEVLKEQLSAFGDEEKGSLIESRGLPLDLEHPLTDTSPIGEIPGSTLSTGKTQRSTYGGHIPNDTGPLSRRNETYEILLRQAKLISSTRPPSPSQPSIHPLRTAPPKRKHSDDLKLDLCSEVVIRHANHSQEGELLRSVMEPDDAGPCLVFYTDGSARRKQSRGAGAAVVYKGHLNGLSSGWKDHAWGIPNIHDSNQAEMLAIVQALQLAAVEVQEYLASYRLSPPWLACDVMESQGDSAQREQAPKLKVTIITDSKYALEHIERFLSGRPPTVRQQQSQIQIPSALIISSLEQSLLALLDTDAVRLEFRWVKSHAGVEGNCRADRLAKAAVWAMLRTAALRGPAILWEMLPLEYLQPRRVSSPASEETRGGGDTSSSDPEQTTRHTTPVRKERGSVCRKEARLAQSWEVDRLMRQLEREGGIKPVERGSSAVG